jgi:hypothetical protein
VKCRGAVVVQTKAKARATSVQSIFREDFDDLESTSPLTKKAKAMSGESLRDGSGFVFNEISNPVPFLLFDLGVERALNMTSPVL